MRGNADVWPSLPFADWQDTCATLQLWTQVVGKIRLAQAPMINHWWQVPLYVTARGLTTSPIPFGAISFQIDFDFVDHRLVIATSEGRSAGLTLEPRPVADFYRELMAQMKKLGISVKSGRCRSKFPTRSPSKSIACTPLTTRTARTASGASWSSAIVCSNNSARGSWAR